MIYYSNIDLTIPHMTFIGRWSPFHKGHTAIIMKKLRERPKLPVLILIRNTKEDQYSPTVRAQYIKVWMIKQHIKGTIMIVPNIEGVYWGRGVGYNTERVEVDEETKKISGTAIRKQMQKGKDDWNTVVADDKSSYLLSSKIASIVEHGLVVWFTGCPSSGKTTLSNALLRIVKERFPHVKTQLLDGDEMRSSPIAQHVGFSKKDRADHIRRMAYMAKMFADHGILVMCAFVSPDRKVRNEAKEIIGKNRFIEIFVKASKKTRMERDTKGLYRQAKLGAVTQLTGYSAPYEPPLQPTIICDTDKQTVAKCTLQISNVLFN
jgi:adenylylsulfate kinase